MSRYRTLAALAALVMSAGLLGGCGSSAAPSATPAPAAPATETTAPGTSAAATEAAPAASSVATIKTSKGTIVVQLRPDKAPQTVANFEKLAKAKFYDGILVHRVEPGFVVQAGDPQTKDLSSKQLIGVIERQKSNSMKASDPPIGTGGPGWAIPLETSDLLHDRGVIAMARSQDPDSAGSQFYITLAPVHELDGSYAVFGTVTSGMDVVDSLAVGDTIRSVRVTTE